MRFWSLGPLIVTSRLRHNHTFRANRRVAEKPRQHGVFRWLAKSAGLRRIVKLRLFARIVRICDRRPSATRVCDRDMDSEPVLTAATAATIEVTPEQPQPHKWLV